MNFCHIPSDQINLNVTVHYHASCLTFNMIKSNSW